MKIRCVSLVVWVLGAGHLQICRPVRAAEAASEVEDTAEKTGELEEVKVSGTRIHVPNVTASDPITSIDGEEIRSFGVVNVAQSQGDEGEKSRPESRRLREATRVRGSVIPASLRPLGAIQAKDIDVHACIHETTSAVAISSFVDKVLINILPVSEVALPHEVRVKIDFYKAKELFATLHTTYLRTRNRSNELKIRGVLNGAPLEYGVYNGWQFEMDLAIHERLENWLRGPAITRESCRYGPLREESL